MWALTEAANKVLGDGNEDHCPHQITHPILQPNVDKPRHFEMPFGVLNASSVRSLSEAWPSVSRNYGERARVQPSHPSSPRIGSVKLSTPDFLLKLFAILQKEDASIIQWDGGRIHIKDPHRLVDSVLGKYFRHNKLSSFQRQLNYFGFHKTEGKGIFGPCVYTHDVLVGADLDSLLALKRKTGSLTYPTLYTAEQKLQLVGRKSFDNLGQAYSHHGGQDGGNQATKRLKLLRETTDSLEQSDSREGEQDSREQTPLHVNDSTIATQEKRKADAMELSNEVIEYPSPPVEKVVYEDETSLSYPSKHVKSSSPEQDNIDRNDGNELLRKQHTPEFLLKLIKILQTEDKSIIEWDNGRIHIKDAGELVGRILGNYFRHNKLSSFQRQLNYFGFHKREGKGAHGACVYQHDTLVGKDVEALMLLKRKTNILCEVNCCVTKRSKSFTDGSDGSSVDRDWDTVQVDETNQFAKLLLCRKLNVSAELKTPQISCGDIDYAAVDIIGEDETSSSPLTQTCNVEYNNSNGDYSTKQCSEFLLKLFEMLKNEDSSIIEWDKGRIRIKDPIALVGSILSKYFRHNKLLSFQRQLNYFGFYKTESRGLYAPCVYVHNALTSVAANMEQLLVLKRKTSVHADVPPSAERLNVAEEEKNGDVKDRWGMNCEFPLTMLRRPELCAHVTPPSGENLSKASKLDAQDACAALCNLGQLEESVPKLLSDRSSTFPLKKSVTPEFLLKLFEILQNEDSSIIEWDDGRINIKDPSRLTDNILGKYFRHNKLLSFQRQLNYFGFHKTEGNRKGTLAPQVYTHDGLVGAKIDDLLLIERKKSVFKRLKVDGDESDEDCEDSKSDGIWNTEDIEERALWKTGENTVFSEIRLAAQQSEESDRFSSGSSATQKQMVNDPQESIHDCEDRVLTKVSIPDFLFKLFQILMNTDTSIIEWDKGHIRIKDPSRFSSILTNYFRHNNVSSFQRQLHYFGFYKSEGKGAHAPCVYTNDSLIGSNLDDLLSLKRKTNITDERLCGSKRKSTKTSAADLSMTVREATELDDGETELGDSEENKGGVGRLQDKYDGPPAPEFLVKLFEILNTEDKSIIEWESGRIHIKDTSKFVANVLGKYFRHNKLSSFQRQLNYFGFFKTAWMGKGANAPCVYTNHMLVGAKLDELFSLKRKSSTLTEKISEYETSDRNETFSHLSPDFELPAAQVLLALRGHRETGDSTTSVAVVDSCSA